MTKKVTGKELKDLLEGALNEKLNLDIGDDYKIKPMKTAFGDQGAKFVPGGAKASDKKKRQALDKGEPKGKFTIADDAGFSKNKSGNLNSAAKNVRLMNIFCANTVWNAMDESEKEYFKEKYFKVENFGVLNRVENFISNFNDIYLELAKQVKKPDTVDQKVKPDPSLTSSTIQTGMTDESQITGDQKALLDSFFAMNNANDLQSRMKALTDFSQLIAKKEGTLKQAFLDQQTEGGQTNIGDVSRNFIVNASVMDIFNNFAKNIDSGAGAYFFEAFLALMSGGKSGGKESGVAGGMGEADFITASGGKGSAKFLAQGSDVEQSWKNFVPGQPVEYIVAYKADKQNRPTSDIEALYKIVLYRVLVENVNGQQVKINGEAKSVSDVVKNGTLSIKQFLSGAEIGDFILPQTDEKSVTDFLKNGGDFVDQEVGKALEYFANIMKSLKDMKSKTITFSSSGSPNDADAALKEVPKFQENISKLQTSYEKGPVPRADLKEQKITSDFLKKLIEESFKK